MTIITSQCPGCGVAQMPLNVRAFSKREEHVVYAFVICPTCHLPAALLLSPGVQAKVLAEWFLRGEALGQFDALQKSGWDILTTFPKYQERDAPEHTPQSIARLYKQAAAAKDRQEFEAAGFLYGKVLETSVKQLDAEVKGTLAQRIDALFSNGVLSGDLKNWAHEIRIIRNDAVHEVEQLDPADVAAIAEFTEAFLMVVYTMREKFKARQSKQS